MSKSYYRKRLKIGYKFVNSGEYPKAVRAFYKILKSDPDETIKLQAYIGLGDALRAEYEIELAEKMYKKALNTAENLENTEKIKFLDEKIENIYVFKRENDINPVQIGSFMRAIMKLLSFLGKTDWF